MSAKGNCYDNALMESFWGTLKNELVHHRRYLTVQQAIREIREYIEIFTTGSGYRHGWDTCPPLPTSRSTTGKELPYEIVDVHY